MYVTHHKLRFINYPGTEYDPPAPSSQQSVADEPVEDVFVLSNSLAAQQRTARPVQPKSSTPLFRLRLGSLMACSLAGRPTNAGLIQKFY